MQESAIRAMSPNAIAQVAAVEADLRQSNHQIGLKTKHVFHGGIYRRVVLLPEGTEMVGVLIKNPTTIIVLGDAFMWGSDGWVHVGNEVLIGSAQRKQHFLANADTEIHMLFPTTARTVDEAEREFTNDFADLLSRRIDAGDETIITGE